MWDSNARVSSDRAHDPVLDAKFDPVLDENDPVLGATERQPAQKRHTFGRRSYKLMKLGERSKMKAVLVAVVAALLVQLATYGAFAQGTETGGPPAASAPAMAPPPEPVAPPAAAIPANPPTIQAAPVTASPVPACKRTCRRHNHAGKCVKWVCKK